MKGFYKPLIAFAMLFVVLGAVAQSARKSLIVARDLGGVSAAPYYDALSLQADHEGPAGARPFAQPMPTPTSAAPESQVLPVHSTRLSPGEVESRPLTMPGLTPLFLIGDDERSRTWLARRIGELRRLHAVGLVVEVQSVEALKSLRRLAPGLMLSPTSGDDLAQRLKLDHYPVLITATRLGP